MEQLKSKCRMNQLSKYFLTPNFINVLQISHEVKGRDITYLAKKLSRVSTFSSVGMRFW